MDSLIKLLPDNIANQIAAGEVIQRPASVVKELVENAVDAGATKIHIEIKDAGKTLIQVIDDGRGMAPMDAQMAFERHATSKIRSAEDLFALSTLGFRGEALPSIAAVSHVTLQTRTPDNAQGIKLELEGSKVVSREPVVCATGANFAVRHLFFNVPARRKFLKQDTTEFQHILDEVRNIAAVRPEIAFTLKHNDQVTLALEPVVPKQRIIDLFGKKRLQDALITIEAETPLVTLRGYVSRTNHTRKRGAQQYLFANERYMKHPFFHRMVLNAYGNMIPKGDQPEYFLYLTVDPASIDVNISPTKTEIKFEAENDIGSIIFSSVRRALMQGAAVPTLDFSAPESRLDIPVARREDPARIGEPPVSPAFRNVSSRINQPTTTIPSSFNARGTIMPDLSDWENFYTNFEKNRTKAATKAIVQTTERLPLPEPILLGEYALLPYQESIYIIQLRQARYQVLYDQLQRSISSGRMVSAPLLFPGLAELTAEEVTTLKAHHSALTALGFDIADMGQNSISINAVPSGVVAGTEEELLTEMLQECAASAKGSPEELQKRLLDTLVKHRLRSFQPPASPALAHELIEELLRLPEHLVAHNGRTITSIITQKELRNRFK